MATVQDILARKGQEVQYIQPQATVLEAALKMNERKIGCLVVTDHARVAGIFTERDILRRVVAARCDPATTRVSDVMTEEVACCRPETDLDEARGVMKNRRIRHLPVVDESRRLCGLISIGDLNAYLSDDQEVTIHFLHEYLYGSSVA
ncbi:MAG: CBS domain-containing protein [Planctomycetota bacterium]|nr:CBS domain-containing protein [Planctomycetota bacterium]